MIKTDPNHEPRLSDTLIDVLVCPRDHADLEQIGAALVCTKCGASYPINNGVPNMLLQRD